jgi:protein TIF31
MMLLGNGSNDTHDSNGDGSSSSNNSNGDAKKKKRGQSKKKKNGSANNNLAGNNNLANSNNTNSSNSNSKPTSLSIVEIEQTLYNLNNQTIIDATVRLSGFHPPPSHRRILGDLAYIECILPSGGGSNGSNSNNQSHIHITATPLGFYVNKSTTSNNNYTFDPTPAKESCYSHTLLDCLLQKSSTLRDSWLSALSASQQRADLLKSLSHQEDAFMQLIRPAISKCWNNHSGLLSGGGSGWNAVSPSTFRTRLDGIALRPAWLVPLPNEGGTTMSTWREYTSSRGKGDGMHRWNVGRAEEELTNMYGMDVKGGALRDWNEELQSARDMSVESFEERMDRAR